MPIKPENKHRYPKNWKEIRAEIQARSGNKCEICGVGNRLMGFRGKDGQFTSFPNQEYLVSPENHIMPNGTRVIEIVCTVMHLDHQPENNGEPGNRPNLKFGCQRCHNRYDSNFRLANRQKTKRE